MSIFKSALYLLIHLFGYSAVLFPSCFDLDFERIEDDLRKSEISKIDSILNIFDEVINVQK